MPPHSIGKLPLSFRVEGAADGREAAFVPIRVGAPPPEEPPADSPAAHEGWVPWDDPRSQLEDAAAARYHGQVFEFAYDRGGDFRGVIVGVRAYPTALACLDAAVRRGLRPPATAADALGPDTPGTWVLALEVAAIRRVPPPAAEPRRLAAPAPATRESSFALAGCPPSIEELLGEDETQVLGFARTLGGDAWRLRLGGEESIVVTDRNNRVLPTGDLAEAFDRLGM